MYKISKYCAATTLNNFQAMNYEQMFLVSLSNIMKYKISGDLLATKQLLRVTERSLNQINIVLNECKFAQN